jgi:hypothetical protein
MIIVKCIRPQPRQVSPMDQIRAAHNAEAQRYAQREARQRAVEDMINLRGGLMPRGRGRW